jgi:hypothetical protein
MGRQLTNAFLLVWIAAALLWDGYAYAKWGSAATISCVVKSWSRWCPFLALLLGALLWHVFGPSEE